MKEQWQSNLEWDFEFSNKGKVRRISTGTKITIQDRGVIHITLKDGRQKNFYFPSMVYRAFKGEISSKQHLIYKDGDRKNCHLDNLVLAYKFETRCTKEFKQKVKKVESLLKKKKRYTLKEIEKAVGISSSQQIIIQKDKHKILNPIEVKSNVIDFEVVVGDAPKSAFKRVFTDAQVIEIKKEYWMNYKKWGIQRSLADKYKTNYPMIHAIVNNIAYTHILVKPIYVGVL